MSISVVFAEKRKYEPSQGTAGLKTQLGGAGTTVSILKEASKATGNESLVKQDIG